MYGGNSHLRSRSTVHPCDGCRLMHAQQTPVTALDSFDPTMTPAHRTLSSNHHDESLPCQTYLEDSS